MRHFLLLLLGVWACSTSVIFIKVGSIDPVWLSAWRLLLASILLYPVYAKQRKLHGGERAGKELRRSIWPAFFLSIHFISWMAGARLTPSAHASLIVNMAPAAMPLALWLFARERVNGMEATGTLLAIAGVLVLSVADIGYSATYALGDAVCFASMLLYTAYLALGRRNRDAPSIWLYVVPAYGIAGVFCVLFALAGQAAGYVEPMTAGPWTMMNILSILGLTLVPTILGHTLVNQALRVLRGQTVVIVNITQFIFAGLMAWPLLGDLPKPMFYPAAVLVMCGALLVVLTASPADKEN